MIKIHKYEQLGHADYGWLNAHYHFSFAEFYDPARMGFGSLRVINDDIVKAGAGFDPHPHRDMEIITYVRRGAITHKDSLGNEGRTAAGDVQVMSAGSGIKHVEYNKENEDTNLYQIWIMPREKGVKPRWDAMKFPKTPVNDSLPLLVSGRKEDESNGGLYIHADAALYGGRISKGAKVAQKLHGLGYVLCSEGEITLDGQRLKKGDGAEVSDQSEVTLAAPNVEAEVIVIDVPA
jgi:redox-sensitive bicupin YhaK (pirin superfamily)